MRGQNLLLFILCGVLIVLIAAIMLFGGDATRDFMRQVTSPFKTTKPQQIPASAPEPEKEKKAEVPKPVKAKPVLPRAEIAASPAPAKPVAVVEPTPPPPIVPAPNEVKQGEKRDEVLTRFPGPAIQATTLANGDLVELLVYQQRDKQTATYVQIQNGSVVQVYSGTAPRRLNR